MPSGGWGEVKGKLWAKAQTIGLREHPGTSQSLNFTQHLVHKQVAEKWAPRGQEPRGPAVISFDIAEGIMAW